MNDSDPPSSAGPGRPAWNKGKLIGLKPPLRPGHVWSIRARLQLARRTRDLAMFNLAIDSKLRGCDLIGLRVDDVAPNGYAVDRATVRQRKTGRPVRFELTEVTRQALDDYLRASGRKPGQCLFPGRGGPNHHLTTRQYARLVADWFSSIGLDPLKFATHSIRRTSSHSSIAELATCAQSNFCSDTHGWRAQFATSVSRWTTRSKSLKRSMSDIPGQSCRALPDSRSGQKSARS